MEPEDSPNTRRLKREENIRKNRTEEDYEKYDIMHALWDGEIEPDPNNYKEIEMYRNGQRWRDLTTGRSQPNPNDWYEMDVYKNGRIAREEAARKVIKRLNNSCSVCKKSNINLGRCRICNDRNYCSEACQIRGCGYKHLK